MLVKSTLVIALPEAVYLWVMDMSLGQILAVSAGTIFVYMSLLYVLAMKIKNASIVDIGWGLGFVIVAMVLLFVTEAVNPAAVVVYSLINIWGLRLTGHLAGRNLGRPEDWRYAAWRKQWGKSYAWRSYLQIFMLQGLMMWLISLSLAVAFAAGVGYLPHSGWLIAGTLVWLVGFLTEVIADWQLSNFLKTKLPKNKSKVMDQGLWRYSRHPNYFGEVTQWWGIWLCVLSLPFGLLALISPLTITWLIVFVSGVPMLEKRYVKDKAYQAYARKTSKLIPLPPKKP